MSTVADIVRRALKLATVLDDEETPEPSEQADGIDSLNELLSSWYDEGISISNGGLEATDTFPIDGKEARAVRYNLAVEIAPEYGKTLPLSVEVKADELYRFLQAKYASEETMDVDETMKRQFNRHNR